MSCSDSEQCPTSKQLPPREILCVTKLVEQHSFFSSLASLAWLSSGNVWVERVCRLETLIKLSNEDIPNSFECKSMTKGQLISKANCQAVNSSKKWTNEFVFTSMRRVFVCFLEEMEDSKKVFWNYLTFSKKQKKTYLTCTPILELDQHVISVSHKTHFDYIFHDTEILDSTYKHKLNEIHERKLCTVMFHMPKI